MRLGKLGKKYQPIRERIESARSAGELSARDERRLLDELFALLAYSTPPGERLKTFCMAHRGMRHPLAQIASCNGWSYCLPQALYACYVKGLLPRLSLERYRGVQSSDWLLVHSLAESLGRDLRDELLALSARRGGAPDWIIRAEADYEEIEIHVEPAALEAMILSVYETYKVPNSTRGPGFTETYGVCFGTRSTRSELRRGRVASEVVSIHLQRAVPQIRARMTSASVSPDMRSTEIFLEVGKRLFRHCEIVGEFHSHPYRDMSELKNAEGWNHSKEDQEYVRAQLDAWRKLRQMPRVFLICAVAKGKSTTTDRLAARKPNLFALHLSDCRFYLAAYRILPNGELAEDRVTIHCCGTLDSHRPGAARERAERQVQNGASRSQ